MPEATGGPAALRDQDGAWPVASSQVLARGVVVTLRADTVVMPGGEQVRREVVEHPGAVAVVALDDAGRVLMIAQYRHPAGATLWELPAGLRDVGGEPPELTARRELAEETGYQAEHWQVLANYLTSPGISTERIVVFLASGLTQLPAGQETYVREHEEAYLRHEFVPLADAVAAVQSGRLRNGVAVVGILAAAAARRPGGSAKGLQQ